MVVCCVVRVVVGSVDGGGSVVGNYVVWEVVWS